MGRVGKGEKCTVINCAEIAIRSISINKAKLSGLKVDDRRRAYLCERHYKEFKKKSKGARQVDRWRWSA